MLDKTRTYMVMNYEANPIAITTRDHNELIPAGNDLNPAVLPLTIDEIVYVNSISKVFKNGLLFFEPDFEEEIYKELRISNWKDILRNKDIYDSITSPTIEKMERILAIDDWMYFDRVFAAYVGLKNSGVNISSNVENIINARYKELRKGKRKTEIQIKTDDIASSNNDAVVSDLQQQLEDMKNMVAQLLASKGTDGEDTATKDPSASEKNAAGDNEQKQKTTSGKKKSNNAKQAKEPVNNDAVEA